MKRLAFFAVLVGVFVVGVAAAATPQPYVQFHKTAFNDSGESVGTHTDWIRIDNTPSSGKTHVYFRTVEVPGEAKGGSSCHGSQDYVTVDGQLIVMDHQSYVLVPITVCGDVSFVAPAICVDDYVNLELYDPLTGTHLGPKSTARLNFLCGGP